MSLFEELEASGSHLVDLEQLLEGVEEQIMPTTKRTSTRKSHKEGMPDFGSGRNVVVAGGQRVRCDRCTGSGHTLAVHRIGS